MTETFTSPISGGIDELWERRADLTPDDADARAAIVAAVDQIDNPKVKTMISWIATDSADHILFGPGSWDAVSNVCQSALDGSITPEDGAKKIEADVMTARSSN